MGITRSLESVVDDAAGAIGIWVFITEKLPSQAVTCSYLQVAFFAVWYDEVAEL